MSRDLDNVKFIAALKCLRISRGNETPRGRRALLTLVNTFYWLYNMFYAWRFTNDPRGASNYFYGTYSRTARKHRKIQYTRDFVITPFKQTVFVPWYATKTEYGTSNILIVPAVECLKYSSKELFVRVRAGWMISFFDDSGPCQTWVLICEITEWNMCCIECGMRRTGTIARPNTSQPLDEGPAAPPRQPLPAPLPVSRTYTQTGTYLRAALGKTVRNVMKPPD